MINLNGYTKGARNDIFAARPAPIQMSLMGFAGMKQLNIEHFPLLILEMVFKGTLAAGWCDYIITDPVSSPPDTAISERWVRQHRTAAAAAPSADVQFSADVEEESQFDVDPADSSELWM